MRDRQRERDKINQIRRYLETCIQKNEQEKTDGNKKKEKTEGKTKKKETKT
jgi:hypothetical protein